MSDPPATPPAYDWALHARLVAEMERDGDCHRFYNRSAWRRLRRRVLDESHGECWDCAHATPARFVPATCVHHQHEVEREPGWALTEWVPDGHGGLERNLWPLCHDCHDRRHGRYAGLPPSERFKAGPPPLTEEWW